MTVLDALKVELAARREAAGDTGGRIERTDALFARLGFASVEEMRACAAQVRAEARRRSEEHRRRQGERLDAAGRRGEV